MLILAAVACVLTVIGIALNYYVQRRIEFSHCLLAFVVWFSGRQDDEE